MVAPSAPQSYLPASRASSKTGGGERNWLSLGVSSLHAFRSAEGRSAPGEASRPRQRSPGDARRLARMDSRRGNVRPADQCLWTKGARELPERRRGAESRNRRWTQRMPRTLRVSGDRSRRTEPEPLTAKTHKPLLHVRPLCFETRTKGSVEMAEGQQAARRLQGKTTRSLVQTP